jgi:Mechanosensitive ion channel, conserved TM helix
MNRVDLTKGLEQAWTNFIAFAPLVLLAVVIFVVGYFIAKLVGRVVGGVLRRVGFDRLAERGGIKRALSKTNYDASGLLAKLVFYALMLVVLQLTFGVFGNNPISNLLTAAVAFLPNVFVAVVIVVVAAAIASAAKDILQASLAGVSYGRVLANVAAGFIIATGVFAALNEINIAPAIINGIFYAILAIIAGSAIVAIGGGGIVPMRARWEKALDRIEEEAPRLRETLQPMPKPAEWKEEVRKAA